MQNRSRESTLFLTLRCFLAAGLLASSANSAELSTKFYRVISEIKPQICPQFPEVNRWLFYTEKISCGEASLGKDSMPYSWTDCPENQQEADDWYVPQGKQEFIESVFAFAQGGGTLGDKVPVGSNPCGGANYPPMEIDCNDPILACELEELHCLNAHQAMGPERELNSFARFMCSDGGEASPPIVGSGTTAYYFDEYWGTWMALDAVFGGWRAMPSVQDAFWHCVENWRRGQYFGNQGHRFSWDPTPILQIRYGNTDRVMFELRQDFGIVEAVRSYNYGSDELVNACEAHRTRCMERHARDCP